MPRFDSEHRTLMLQFLNAHIGDASGNPVATH